MHILYSLYRRGIRVVVIFGLYNISLDVRVYNVDKTTIVTIVSNYSCQTSGI